MSNETPTKMVFRMSVVKKDGEERRRDYDCMNQAVQALWKVRDVVEGFVTCITETKAHKVVAKVGRRRGINTVYTTVTAGRPMLKKLGDNWQRLPSRFNDLQ